MEYVVAFDHFSFKHSFDQRPVPECDIYQNSVHTAYEILYFIRGNGSFFLQHNCYTLHPHSLLLIPPGYYHYIVLDPSEPYDRIVIRFFPMDVSPSLQPHLSSLKSLYALENSPLSHELLTLDRYYAEIIPDLHPAVFAGQLNIILAYLCEAENLAQKNIYANQELARVITYIDNHLSAVQTIEDLACAMHLSASTIQKMFSGQLHTSVMSYVRTQRCIRANTLISNGFSATEAATLCGFNYYSTFYRAYEKIFGHPPSSGK